MTKPPAHSDSTSDDPNNRIVGVTLD